MYSALLMAILIALLSVQLAESYVSTEYNFSIDFPSGWVEDTNPDVVVQFSDPSSSASMNIVVEETQLSLPNYVSGSKNYLESNLYFYQLESEGNITIGELNGYELVYTWTHIGTPNYDVWDRQVFFVANGTAYVITCGADYLEYGSYLSTFDNSLNSFALISQTPTPTPTPTLTPTPTPTLTPTPTATPTPTPTPPNTILGLRISTLIIIATVIAALVVLAIVVLLLRRRRQSTQQKPSSTGSGGTYPPSTQPPPPLPPPPPPPP